MRYFFSAHEPPHRRVLLVESGSRALLEPIITAIYDTYDSEIDLVTCYAGAPDSLRLNARIWRVTDYPDRAARKQFLKELAAAGYDTVGILCSDEPIMSKWKWAVAWRVPAKVFAVNENSDWFWLHRHNLDTIAHFISYRAGLSGANGAATLGRLALFPFMVSYLLLYAAVVHLRRQIRIRSHV